MEVRPRIAITMGDAAGIGPEITVKSLADPVAAAWAIPVVLGDAGVLERAMAVAGLNPHAGESGAFGREEQEEIIPAIAAARARGIGAEGPFPADTVFLKARDGVYDLTLALYHDQGLMAVKLVGFGRVVTLLIGLPLIRTSTGHGTAFDIAGRNLADHRNLLEAIRVAAEVASAKRGSPDRGLAAAYGRAA